MKIMVNLVLIMTPWYFPCKPVQNVAVRYLHFLVVSYVGNLSSGNHMSNNIFEK